MAFRNEKFEATGETKVVNGVTLHRIRAVKAIAALGIAAGALGGWIAKENNLSVSGNAWVYGDARVSGNASKTPVNIIGVQYKITITDHQMSIGCQHHTLEEWWAFDDRAILEMDGKGALKFWRVYKPILQAICADTGRNAGDVA